MAVLVDVSQSASGRTGEKAHDLVLRINADAGEIVVGAFDERNSGQSVGRSQAGAPNFGVKLARPGVGPAAELPALSPSVTAS